MSLSKRTQEALRGRLQMKLLTFSYYLPNYYDGVGTV